MRITKFTDVIGEIYHALSNCESNYVVNEKLLWYMYKKCDYNFLELKCIVESVFPHHDISNSASINDQLLEYKKGKHILNK